MSHAGGRGPGAQPGVRSDDGSRTSSLRAGARTWLVAVLVLVGVLRLLMVRSLPLNSDEPQHLHVVWSWTQGLLPYRDLFDNHTPLFQMLAAPVLALIGESPSTLGWMRAAMLPWTLLALLCLWWLGRSLWSERVATWAVAVAALFPAYFAIAAQFRPDAMWAFAWLAALAVALGGRWETRRAFGFGVLVGVCFSISFKSTLLIGGLGLAWAIAQWAMPAVQRVGWRASLRSGAMILGGALLVPGLLTLFFATQGALGDLAYCVIGHNIVPGLGTWSGHESRKWLLLLTIAGIALLTRWWLRAEPRDDRMHRRMLLWLSALSYYLLLYGIWPLFTRQDRMVALPIVCLCVVGWLAGMLRKPRYEAIVLSLVVFAEVAALLQRWPPSHPRDVEYRAYVANILQFTRPGEYVMDAKGESLFRPRPFYYALEGITRERIRLGLIRDDIAARLIGTRTRVVGTAYLPPDAERFVAANYLAIAPSIRVAGQRIALRGAGDPHPVTIVIPAYYALTGPSSGFEIDGVAYRGPAWLASGRHIVSAQTSCDCMLLSQPDPPFPASSH